MIDFEPMYASGWPRDGYDDLYISTFQEAVDNADNEISYQEANGYGPYDCKIILENADYTDLNRYTYAITVLDIDSKNPRYVAEYYEQHSNMAPNAKRAAAYMKVAGFWIRNDFLL
jgi:hypothetical protein